MILRIASLSAVTVLAACGGGGASCDTANIAATCNIASLGQCTEYTGLASVDGSGVKLFCTTNNGAWTQGSSDCGSTNRLGSCKIPAADQGTHVTCPADATVTVRYFAPYTSTQAQNNCNGVTGGVWTPN